MFWDDARRALVLRVRRIPHIDARRPLAGLTIAVDAGHPPGGATGATGLTEADAVLPVAKKLAAMLQERGATVVMTRTTRDAVGLTDRPVMARRANAHARLSASECACRWRQPARESRHEHTVLPSDIRTARTRNPA